MDESWSSDDIDIGSWRWRTSWSSSSSSESRSDSSRSYDYHRSRSHSRSQSPPVTPPITKIHHNGSSSSSSKRLKTSHRGRRCSDDNGIDRISELPDSVLHHILSFIDMQEVIGNTSLISKRWRNLWLSLPILNFYDPPISISTRRRHKHSFTRFVDRVLLRRANSFIKSLSIKGGYYSPSMRSIEDWMIYAAGKNVEQVCFNLRIGSRKDFIWPKLSKIQVFKLQAETDLFIPNSLFLDTQLKSLSLNSVRLPKDKVVTLSCLLLENLSLTYCSQKHVQILKISAPKLKDLEIQNDDEAHNDSCKLQISTPNLTSLLLTGTMYQGYSFENLSSLVKAKIDCHEVPDDADILRKILEGVHNVTTLELCSELVQKNSVRSVDHHRGLLNTSFVNLKSLKIIGWSGGSCMHTIHSLLKNSYSLEDLVLESYHVRDAHDWRELFPYIHHLKSFEIQAVKGSRHERKLFEFILKNAVALEDFTIHCHWKFRKNAGRKELAKFNMKIHALPRASSTVKILGFFLN